MRIAIVGAGVAGCYLARQLSAHFQVDIFEKRRKRNWGRDCAWITNWGHWSRFCEKAGLHPSDYVCCRASRFISDTYEANDPAIFDKNRFLRDLVESSPATVHKARVEKASDLPDYDLLVDATGFSRALLPRDGDMSEWMLPCYQVEVEGESLPDEFRIEQKGTGYLWFFPLQQDGKRARVGCGSFDVSARRAVLECLSEHLGENNYRAVRSGVVGGMIRMIPPSRSRPLYVAGRPFLIGVGESVGTVSPLSGEGILPALECADILAGLLKAGRAEWRLEAIAREYERRVLKEFDWMEAQFRFLQAVRLGNRVLQLIAMARVRIPDCMAARFRWGGVLLKWLCATLSGAAPRR